MKNQTTSPKKGWERNEISLLVKLGFNNTLQRLLKMIFLTSYSTETTYQTK